MTKETLGRRLVAEPAEQGLTLLIKVGTIQFVAMDAEAQLCKISTKVFCQTRIGDGWNDGRDKLSLFQLLPINVPEEAMFLDFLKVGGQVGAETFLGVALEEAVEEGFGVGGEVVGHHDFLF